MNGDLHGAQQVVARFMGVQVEALACCIGTRNEADLSRGTDDYGNKPVRQ
jgi:hypothetical protein